MLKRLFLYTRCYRSLLIKHFFHDFKEGTKRNKKHIHFIFTQKMTYVKNWLTVLIKFNV